ncbi:hypothetical protein J2Y45_004773 [Dyadobacter sp. BE34]|uniref:Uncharacterized protein n=1 Tax=Dyadobacter fermentans TaxID=94254 RepID=A0ABU1R2E1_9BACT|nr:MULTISPECIES: hypothetical protein [Dyadobacter]MDR6807573.1 hypothetical protein [Dyadobacter fermentans]MDR7045314.1 hypothetical protein [Dyadobacter sp. BE242]MDR7199627.1 hypothetical protein [Dyadobacter sp. BE34]MDR7217914.1 hypothetical protein [Dyadobacter sp. BE31]MDR7265518.1 hypothetical protein [Dyadobacter sp. BE32]
MKDQSSELLKEKDRTFKKSFPDLSNDPFLLRKMQKAIEYLTESPLPRHLGPKRKRLNSDN